MGYDPQEIRALVDAEFDCDHPQTEKRRRVLRNGTQRVEQQCTRCGATLGAVKRHPLDAPISTLPVYDEELNQRWFEARNARWQELAQQGRDQESAQWWARYHAYLQTPAWQEKRALVLERDRYVCQGCGLQRATDVHHLTYEHLGNEFLFELASICRVCHERLHGRPLGRETGQ